MPSIPHPWGEGEPGSQRGRTAGAGEGEGGETMPDAEASPPFPNEAAAENSIEGEPLRMKNSGPAGCRPVDQLTG
jgi:hypothetical protein